MPIDILIEICSAYLSPSDFSSLTLASKTFHSLTRQDFIFKSFCRKFKGIHYKTPELSWKELFYIKDPVCPHINTFSIKCLSLPSLPADLNDLKCSDCDSLLPDLWICLTPHCYHIGCGRGVRKHAYHHYSDTEIHHLTMKIKTLELWCYACNKWIGGFDTHPCERYFSKLVSEAFEPIVSQYPMIQVMIKENERRQRERWIYGLSRNDVFYFVSSVWWRVWRSFLIGDESFPQAIDNTMLMENGKLMPHLSPMVDFHIFSEENWARVCKIYGGGPGISERDIDESQYIHLRSQLKMWRGWLPDGDAIVQDIDEENDSTTDSDFDHANT